MSQSVELNLKLSPAWAAPAFVRVIDAFVEALNVAELGFDGIEPAATGRPAYHPSSLLKLYIYGYLNRVQSSRRLEREAGRNVE
jgi:transposase